jgi:hypothetical protein
MGVHRAISWSNLRDTDLVCERLRRCGHTIGRNTLACEVDPRWRLTHAAPRFQPSQTIHLMFTALDVTLALRHACFNCGFTA